MLHVRAVQCNLNFVKSLIQLVQSLLTMNVICSKGIYEQLLSQSSHIIGLFNSKTDNTGACDAKLSDQISTAQCTM